jgi:hypothetical protein
MSMTEKQGSDVRANTTMATPEDPTAATGNGAAYRQVGHKVTRVFDLPP